MGFYNRIEKNVKLVSSIGVRQLIKYYGIDLEIHKLKKTVYSDVYGSNSGGPITETVINIVGLLVGDDFFEEDKNASGNFEFGYLYVDTDDESKVKPGDIVKVVRDDKTSFRYKVGKIESLGFTTKVFHRFELVSLGD